MSNTIPENEYEILNSIPSGKEAHNFSPTLMKSIYKIIQSEGYITHSIDQRNVSTAGGSYLSILTEVDIKGKTVNNNNRETNLFVKQSLPESDKNLLSPKDLFLRELFVYTDLAEVVFELQNEFNVPDAEKYKIVKCYCDDNSDSVILENMEKQGFKTYNRLDVMPLKALELTVEQIAKFHGFSIIIKKYRPDYFKAKIQSWKNPLIFNDVARSFCESLCNISMEVLDNDRRMKLEKCIPGLLNIYDSCLNNNESKVKCLCHGDVRMNNILVKEIDGEVMAVIPIDFQAMYYGSPVIDLLYLIFSSTDQNIRKNDMKNLKNIYFESLKKYLRYFSIDVESVYPQKEFENDFKRQLDYGLITSLILLPFVLAAEDDLPEVANEVKKVKLHKNFKPRLQEIVDDFIEWGYL